MVGIMGMALAGLLACFWSGAQAQSQPLSGAELAGRLGCFACHSRPGPGRAAPLHGIGGRLSPPKLRLAITQPRQLHPQARMPSYAYLPPAEIAALVSFLESYK